MVPSMDAHAGPATEPAIQPMVRVVAEGPQAVAAAPGIIFLLAIWIGLVAGFLDLGILMVRRRLIGADFYRLGEQFLWIIPAGVAALLLIPATVLAAIAL